MASELGDWFRTRVRLVSSGTYARCLRRKVPSRMGTLSMLITWNGWGWDSMYMERVEFGDKIWVLGEFLAIIARILLCGGPGCLSSAVFIPRVFGFNYCLGRIEVLPNSGV